MHAIRMNQYGGPEVLKLEEIDRPSPAPDEILVKVFASGVNPVDWVVRNGENEGMRAFLPLPMTPGWDAAGRVEAVGSDVTDFRKGDAVFGVPNFPGDSGSYAEYTVGKASQFARKPERLSFIEAAAVPLAALTGWTAMFGHGRLQAGQRILITGASGGVGSFAVQFAKACGAYVIGVASTANVAYVKSLGADEVIDYKTQQLEDVIRNIDVVLEASPVRDNDERIRLVGVLNKGGIFVSVNVDFPFNDKLLDALAEAGVSGALSPNEPRQDWLREIARLIDDGKVNVLVSNVYPLARVADAHRESETWHVRGKLVLEVRKEQEAVKS